MPSDSETLGSETPGSETPGSEAPGRAASPRPHVLAELRRKLARLESLTDERGEVLPFGVPVLDRQLPGGGLAFGAVHEIAPREEADLPAAFGFLAALLGRMPGRTPLLLVLASRRLARLGTPHGHGLAALGLDPARLTLVETTDETEALWATEEAVRARGPAAVASALDGKIDLKASQRLLHAARDSGTPLFILRPGGGPVATAVTRWHIGAARGGADCFDMRTGWRWHAALVRCRNGRPGHWMLEFDHATHRFRLAAGLAGASLAQSESESLRAAG